MDDIQKRLTQMLEEWPDCVDDRRQFRSLLQDYIPQNKLQANLLLNAYDEDVVTQLKSCSDVTLHALQLAKSLSDNYGVTKESAIWSVVTWCYMLRQNKIAESIEGTFPIVPSTSTADIIQQTTPKKKMKLGCGMYLPVLIFQQAILRWKQSKRTVRYIYSFIPISLHLNVFTMNGL